MRKNNVFSTPPTKNSIRHHYIPQFFIEGFKNREGLLYIYDKDKDKIIKTPRPPKSIFFEKDRNTIALTDKLESSILEDSLYSQIDTESSKVVRYFRTEALKKIDFNTENTAQFQFFLITLFWRIPYTDFASEELMERAEISSPVTDPELLRNDPTFKKIQRAFLANHHIKEIVNSGNKGKFSVNVHKAPINLFVVGDNPLLFRNTPSVFSEFNTSDFLIAISSDRIYSSTNQVFENTSLKNWSNYNAAVIQQSTRYVSCGSYDFLKKSIEYYKELKKHNLHFSLPEQTFNTE